MTTPFFERCAAQEIDETITAEIWRQIKHLRRSKAYALQEALGPATNDANRKANDKLAAELIKKYPAMKMTKVMVSEAGASVYSASELASKEFPDLDVSIRGAVSIARRLQDPLAELVKIEPKAIGVGQYQHDVNQHLLARSLDATVEDCVNAVGVDVNTASVELLSYVAGLTRPAAEKLFTVVVGWSFSEWTPREPNR